MRFNATIQGVWRYLTGKKMIIAKSAKDLDKMREVGELIAEVREALRVMVKPGVSTLELNTAAEKMIRDAGAIPTFIGYHGFPFAICASVNHEIVHGFQSPTRSMRATSSRSTWRRRSRGTLVTQR